MTKSALTAKSVSAFTAKAKAKQETFDAIVPGFGVRADGKGSGSWVLVYVAPITGKRRRYSISRLTEMTLASARARAGELKATIAAGIDPADERKANSATTEAAAADTSATFRAVWGVYYKRHGSTLANGPAMQRTIDREVMPAWGDRNVADITRYDVADLTGGVADSGRPAAAHSLFDVVRGFFNYCIKQALVRGMVAAPTDRMAAPTKIIARDRILSDDEIKAVWSAFDVAAAPFGGLFKVLLLTGQRRTETSRMRWADVNLETGAWTIPASDAKSGKEHTVHLSPLAVEIILAQPKVSWSEYVFAGRAANPVSGYSKAKARADELSGISDWRLHDLRRTCRSGMARLGVPVMVAERVLNHELGGLIGIYDRHGYDEEMTQAWKRWSDHVAGVVAPKSDKVVPIGRKGNGAR